ncbi:MAG: hypothetical protein ABI330_19555 [Caldimonas sp.]
MLGRPGLEVAIPKKLSKEHGIALVGDFAQELAYRYGMTVDSDVHHDDLGSWDGSERRRPFIGVRTEDDARVVTQRGQARALLAWRMTDTEAHQDAAGGLG